MKPKNTKNKMPSLSEIQEGLSDKAVRKWIFATLRIMRSDTKKMISERKKFQKAVPLSMKKQIASFVKLLKHLARYKGIKTQERKILNDVIVLSLTLIKQNKK